MATSATPSTGLGRFLEQARTAEKLDRETERMLATRARAGDRAARERLLCASLRFVVAIATRYARYRVPVADLISEGNVGLCLAVDRFDPDCGTRFVTYAGHWIRAQIIDHVLRNRTLVGGGTGALRSKVYFRLQRERARLDALTMDHDTQRRVLAESFGTSEAHVGEMLARLDARDVSLDAPMSVDSPVARVEMLPSDSLDAHETLVERRRARARDRSVARALESLDPRERRIVERRQFEDEEVTLATLANEFGVSRERARQLEARAHKKLAEALTPYLEAVA